VSDGVTKLNIRKLARRGPTDTVPCALCGSPTTSHAIYTPASSTEVYEVDEDLTAADEGEPVTFAIVCHSCRVDGVDSSKLDEEKEAVFKGVVG
jgi:hypothetical protein